jgi:hypothetical protein
MFSRPRPPEDRDDDDRGAHGAEVGAGLLHVDNRQVVAGGRPMSERS